MDEAQRVPPARPREDTIILVVDDHSMMRWPTAMFLRHEGYKVVEAADATEAMGLAASGVQIDAVFSDVHLGSGPTGYELARWFARHRPEIPVLLASGKNEGAITPKNALRGFVRKPYELDQVAQLLQSMLAG